MHAFMALFLISKESLLCVLCVFAVRFVVFVLKDTQYLVHNSKNKIFMKWS